MNMKHLFLYLLMGLGMMSKAQTKKPFSYTGSFTLNYEQKKASSPGAEKGTVLCAFSGFDAAIIPSFATTMQDVAGAKLLVNTSVNEMTMLTTMKKGNKTGLLTTIPKPVMESSKNKAPVITKTGITKTIQTFSCEKILVSIGDTTKMETWVTNGIALNVADALQLTNSGFKSKSPLYGINMGFLSGTPLETLISCKNGDTIKISISDIKKVKPDAAFFNSAGFSIMDARGLPMFNGN